MRKFLRVTVLSLLGLLSTALLGALTALLAAVSLAATTALIVPGTGTPDANVVEDYMENFRDYYMQDTPCTVTKGCGEYDPDAPRDGGLLGVDYFASFWPLPLPGWCDPGRCEKFDVSVADGVDNLRSALENISNLDPAYDGDVVIAGYSQGARVATIAKMRIASGEWDEFLKGIDSVGFVFIGNPNRPNGGILSRFGILGTIPILDVTTGQPTPTNTKFRTEDWAIRWEGIADFPQYLLNPLAVVNSLLGFYYDHGTYLAINEDSDPGETPAGYTPAEWEAITASPERYPGIVDIQKYGDTTYYTVTPKVLPLVRPLHSIPLLGKPIADLIEPALRVIIEETGYNRNISFGQPTEIGLVPIFNPITLVVKLIPAIFQGINNFLANFGLATEIPLSPTVPITPASPLIEEEDDLGVATLMSNEQDESPDARLTLLTGNGELEQQIEGDENTVVPDVETEGGLTPIEGTETPVEGALEPLESELEESPAGNVEGLVEEDTDVNQGNGNAGSTNQDPKENKDPEEAKDPEENKDAEEAKDPQEAEEPQGNRVDAHGGGVSSNFSPNKPEGAKSAEGSEPAAA